MLESTALYLHCEKTPLIASLLIVPSEEATSSTTEWWMIALWSATYFELSIFLGYYEVLATGGYYFKTNGSVVPFVASSLANWQHDTKENGSILVTGVNMKRANVSTERLLNQYRRDHSHNLWGFHSAAASLRGFMPINPLHVKNPMSQRNEDRNMHRFASYVVEEDVKARQQKGHATSESDHAVHEDTSNRSNILIQGLLLQHREIFVDFDAAVILLVLQRIINKDQEFCRQSSKIEVVMITQ
ncbi:hypothetical protein MBANPS3_010210 [Mucor bainieri]